MLRCHGSTCTDYSWQQLHFVKVYVEIESLITLFLSGVFPQTKKQCTVNEREITADDKFKDVHTVKHRTPDHGTPDQNKVGPTKFRHLAKSAETLLVNFQGCRNKL